MEGVFTMRSLATCLSPVALLGFSLSTFLGCASTMTDVIAKDVKAFRNVESSQGAIPTETLAQAKGIAIFSSTQAGVIFGGKGGDGVFMKRLDDGFSPPLAVDLVEGTVGLQLGAQSEDAVYIFKTDAAVEHFLTTGRYAIAHAQGSFGEESAKTKPAELKESDVQVYVNATGVYGGLLLGGAGFAIDEDMNRKTYGDHVTTDMIVNGEVPPPAGTLVLWNLIDND